MSKFSVYPDQPGRWQRTPPSYMDGTETEITSFDSASNLSQYPHLPFHLIKNLRFIKKFKRYDISLK
jgi:hypothetical protein